MCPSRAGARESAVHLGAWHVHDSKASKIGATRICRRCRVRPRETTGGECAGEHPCAPVSSSRHSWCRAATTDRGCRQGLRTPRARSSVYRVAADPHLRAPLISGRSPGQANDQAARRKTLPVVGEFPLGAAKPTAYVSPGKIGTPRRDPRRLTPVST
jgi:hypothetical protein